jgi:hypothetical protein
MHARLIAPIKKRYVNFIADDPDGGIVLWKEDLRSDTPQFSTMASALGGSARRFLTSEGSFRKAVSERITRPLSQKLEKLPLPHVIEMDIILERSETMTYKSTETPTTVVEPEILQQQPDEPT